MKLEFHQLDRSYEHLRLSSPQRQRQLLASESSIDVLRFPKETQIASNRAFGEDAGRL
jgi:hypothetical protein